MIPGTDLSRCRCGAAFKFVGHGKRLCPPCMARWKQRRAAEATFPKCKCGATLGLERVSLGIERCGACDRYAVIQERQRKLAEFADRYL